MSPIRTLVYVPGGAAAAPARTLVWVDDRCHEEAIKMPARAYVAPRLSPDGARVALEVRDQDNDIWVFDLARETLTRVTFDPGLDAAPAWMPDGRRIVFSSQLNEGAPSLWSQAADGTGKAERLTQNPSRMFQFPSAVSPDGTRVLFTEGGRTPHSESYIDKDHRCTLVQTRSELNGESHPRVAGLRTSPTTRGRFRFSSCRLRCEHWARQGQRGGTRPLGTEWSEVFYPHPMAAHERACRAGTAWTRPRRRS